MGFTWEGIYSFFTPPASRNASPQGSPSLFSSTFFSKPTDKTTSSTKQTDLPMPPISFSAAAAMPSPAESSTSLACSERDYFPPSSPHQQQLARRPSISSTTTSTSSSSTPSERQQQPPAHPQRTTTAPISNPGDDQGQDRNHQPALRRSATDLRGPPEPLSRDFPKPAHEPSLDELLAREPGKWSLSHYVKRARVSPAATRREEEEGEAERARRLEEAKRELLRAKEEIDGLAAGRR